MPAVRWISLTLLVIGYCMALDVGQLGLPAVVTLGLLIMAGICVTQFKQRAVVCFGHGLFILLALGLATHWLPGFYNGRGIAAERFSPDAAPFSMFLNLDKPLIGFWLLLACPWLLTAVTLRQAARATLLTLPLTAAICMGAAMALGVIGWAPKWPQPSLLWLLNNLLLVTLTEELLFRAYLQGSLQRLLQRFSHAPALAIALSAVVFGLAHTGAGWQWALLATLAGVGYGIAFHRGGLPAAVLTHFGVNLVHFGLFTYPMFDR
jgi:membrane protease YdiL (CAAX protease family)